MYGRIPVLPSETAETDVGPPCLEIFRIGAGRNFAVFPLCREPYFYIISLGSGETDITGAQGNDMIRKAQCFQDVFGIVRQFSSSS